MGLGCALLVLLQGVLIWLAVQAAYPNEPPAGPPANRPAAAPVKPG